MFAPIPIGCVGADLLARKLLRHVPDCLLLFV